MKIHEDLKTGNIFPDFELPDQDGEMRSFSELMGSWPTIIVFWRGQY
jgi:peroxiredoxin